MRFLKAVSNMGPTCFLDPNYGTSLCLEGAMGT